MTTTAIYGNWTVASDTTGLYLKTVRNIPVISLEIDYDEDGYPYQMVAFFDPTLFWVGGDDLPYTNEGVERGINNLLKELGLNIRASWSEYGRQTGNAMDFDLSTVKGEVSETVESISQKCATLMTPPKVEEEAQSDFVKGTWVVLSGTGGELDRFFVPENDTNLLANLLSFKLIREWTEMSPGDKIEFIEGESEVA